MDARSSIFQHPSLKFWALGRCLTEPLLKIDLYLSVRRVHPRLMKKAGGACGLWLCYTLTLLLGT